jgi:hypothetical protein
MYIKNLLNIRTSLAICAVGVGALAAQPAAAQSKACVSLLAGAGYAAWMAVKFGDSFYWSSSFPIGQTRCIDLPVSGMVDGAPYSVVVSAVLGSSKVACTPPPSPYSSSNTNSLSYLAWGTTLNVKCEMPGSEIGATTDIGATPSKEGLEALESWKKAGPQPAPKAD